MPVSLTLTDTEGRLWDFAGVNPIGVTFPAQTGQGVLNGSSDAYDGGLALSVNGVLYNPTTSSLGVNGRELNLNPVVMAGGTVAVTRSFLVSDATISPIGFARALDSFTNLTNTTQTITVSIVSDVGSDSATAVVTDTSGNNAIGATDFGFVTDESFNLTGGDSSVGFAYGNGLGLAPSAAGRPLNPGEDADEITVRYTITLAPGETKSLLSFAFQNTTAAQGTADLPTFTRSLQALENDNLLAGISATERATIVNYSESATGNGDFVLIDGSGTQWGIDVSSRTLSTIGSSAVRETSYGNGSLGPAFTTLASSGLGENGREASFRYTPSIAGLGPSSVDYSYFAAPDRDWVRQLVTFNGAPGVAFNTAADGLVVQTGGSLIADIPQASLIGNGAVALDDRAWIFDDSASGSDGTSPALGVVVGNFQFNSGVVPNASDRATFSSGQLEVERQHIFQGTQSFLFFFTSSETAGSTFASTAQLLTPGFRELAGMSDAEVASIRNFTLTSADRLDEQLGTVGNDSFAGNYWGDQIDGLDGDDLIIGGGSDDILMGSGGRDTMSGGIGNDMVNGGTGDDDLFGDAGNDMLTGGTGNDLIDGGDGIDVLLFSGAANRIVLDLGRTTPQDTGDGIDTISRIENVIATPFDDLISGGLNSGTGHVISGGNGNDIIFGLGANDIFDGGDGNDTLIGGAGADQLIGGIGNDTLNPGAGDDVVDGGTGIDLLLFSDATARIVIDLGRTTAQNTGQGLDTISNIENVIGSNFDDLITAGIASGTGNIISGGGGADIIFGLGANETFDGGAGDDFLIGNGGTDILLGGADADTLDGGTGDDFLDGGTGTDTLSFGTAGARAVVNLAVTTAQNTEQGNDTIQNIENVTGSAFNDLISGNSLANILTGVGGADILFGGDGNDTYRYLATSDSAPATRDLIAGFEAGDRIDLSAIDADSVAVGNNGFTFIGAAVFGNVAGQLRVAGAGTNWQIQGDINGDGIADFSIDVTTVVPGFTWTPVDFVL